MSPSGSKPQGYELEVCKGGAEKLNQFDVIFSECNRQETYEGCPMVEDMDAFLSEFSFVRVETKWVTDYHSWGDAVWIKKEKLIKFTVVPRVFWLRGKKELACGV